MSKYCFYSLKKCTNVYPKHPLKFQKLFAHLDRPHRRHRRTRPHRKSAHPLLSNSTATHDLRSPSPHSTEIPYRLGVHPIFTEPWLTGANVRRRGRFPIVEHHENYSGDFQLGRKHFARDFASAQGHGMPNRTPRHHETLWLKHATSER